MFQRFAVVAATMLAVVPAHAALIDFETIPGGSPSEGLTIDNQFTASAGVSFSLLGGGSPVLAEVGAPLTAFAGAGGSDMPADTSKSGSFFLTDDGEVAGLSAETLVVSYSTPTGTASGEIYDIDYNESFEIRLYTDLAGTNLVDTITIAAGDAMTGNGVATPFSFSRATNDIARLELEGSRTAAGFFGLGFDNFETGVTPNTAPVPLPAGLPLLASGVALLELARRRH